MGKLLLPDPRGVARHVPIENSCGMMTTIQTHEGMSRLIVVSQLGPVSLQEARKDRFQWPLIREDHRYLTTEERIVMIGASMNGVRADRVHPPIASMLGGGYTREGYLDMRFLK